MSDLFCNELCIDVRLLYFNDVDSNALAYHLLNVCTELFDLCTASAYYDTRLCTVDVDSYLLTAVFIGKSFLAGPIGIFAMAGEVGQQGAAAAGMAGALLNIFSFVALIAINLAVMNLLPIPALDGGQILFLLVGGIYHFFTHRRIDQKYLGYINMAGFFCLIALMVVVAVSDVNKLIL